MKSYNDYNIINESQLGRVEESAANGKCADIVRLYRHHYIGLGNKKEGVAWLEIGEKFGCEKCSAILKKIREINALTDQ